VESLAAGKMQIGRSSLTLAISGGKLRANLKQLELYGGKGRGVITLDETAAGPRIGLDFEISGVQAEPFLTDAMGFQKLTGTGNVALRVVAAGRSQRGWMQSLGGTAQIRFADGSIKGINLAEIARTISSALTGTAVGSSAITVCSSGYFSVRRRRPTFPNSRDRM
jgi:AsmA protein